MSRGGDFDGAFTDGTGEGFGLKPERIKLRLDQSIPVGAEVKKTGDRDKQCRDIDRQNAPR